MVHVEQRALRALEEDCLAALHLVSQLLAGVADVGGELLAQLGAPRVHRLQVDRLAAQRTDLRVRLLEPFGEPAAQRAHLEEVAHPDPAARHLVLVTGADSAPRGADLGAARLLLAADVDPLVVRQDDVGVLAHHQLGGVGEEAAGLEQLDLVLERFRVDHHAVADEAALSRVQHAAGHEMEDRLHAADDQRVAGVGSALVAHHHVGPRGEEVDDFPLPLVAPLSADDHDVRHGSLSTTAPRPRPHGLFAVRQVITRRSQDDLLHPQDVRQLA